jgi:hypothetical protein
VESKNGRLEGPRDGKLQKNNLVVEKLRKSRKSVQLQREARVERLAASPGKNKKELANNTMESSDKRSKISFTSSLDIFSVPESDFSVVDSQYVAITPKSTLSDVFSPILFHVPPNTQAYYDFGSSCLVFSAKVTNKDGTALSGTDSVAPSSLFFYTAFKNCSVSIQGNLISENNHLYSYRAILPTILTTGEGNIL